MLDVGTGSGTRPPCSPSWRRRSSRSSACRARRAGAGGARLCGLRRVGVRVGDGTLGARPRALRGIARAAAAPACLRRSTRSSSWAGGSSCRSASGGSSELVVHRPAGRVVRGSVPCRFVPLVGEEGFRVPDALPRLARVPMERSPAERRLCACPLAGRAGPESHNWAQLAKFCAVGASGYAVNLAVYTTSAARGGLPLPRRGNVLVPRRGNEQLHLEPRLDVPGGPRPRRLPGAPVSRGLDGCPRRQPRAPDGARRARRRQGRGPGDRDRARDAAELRRQQAVVV